MQLRCLSVLNIAIAFAVMSQPSRASQTGYEGFGPGFPIDTNSGTGFSDSWAQGGFNALALGYAQKERAVANRLRVAWISADLRSAGAWEHTGGIRAI
jgi:hypothetical protein